MTDDASIRIRIQESEKQNWEEYIENSRFRTLTGLIKESVNNEIRNEWVLKKNLDNSDTGVPDDLDDSLNEITARLDTLETNLDNAVLGPSAPEELDDHELMTLANRCHDNLPVVQDAQHLRDLTPVPGQHTMEPRNRPKITGLAQDIAGYLEESEGHVRQALIFLEHEQTTAVKSFIHDGNRRWFEVDETVERWGPSDIELEEEIEDHIEERGFEPGTDVSEPESEGDF